MGFADYRTSCIEVWENPNHFLKKQRDTERNRGIHSTKPRSGLRGGERETKGSIRIQRRLEEADGFGVNGFHGHWVLLEKEIKLSVYLLKCYRLICAKNCKIATGLLNSSRIQVKTCKSCSHFRWIEYQLYSKNIWMQKLSTETKQKILSSSPPFFGFKHRKMCLNTETKHAHNLLLRFE